MKGTVIFHEEFLPEFFKLPEETQDKLIANARLLEQYGAKPYPDLMQTLSKVLNIPI